MHVFTPEACIIEVAAAIILSDEGFDTIKGRDDLANCAAKGRIRFPDKTVNKVDVTTMKENIRLSRGLTGPVLFLQLCFELSDAAIAAGNDLFKVILWGRRSFRGIEARGKGRHNGSAENATEQLTLYMSPARPRNRESRGPYYAHGPAVEPALLRQRMKQLGNSGGFSGAKIKT